MDNGIVKNQGGIVEEWDRKYDDGVCRAMGEFLNDNPEWEILERFDNCNGLTVLGRK